MNNKRGFSIIEILVAITIFAVIGVLVTRSISMTLRGSKKSDSLVRVRENLNYSLAVIERQIRNAESITACTGATSNRIDYTSLEGIDTSFVCTVSGTDRFISSGSARLTSDDILISTCSFTCNKQDINNPAIVRVSVVAEDGTSQAVDKGSISSDIEIVTRNY